MLQAGMGCEMNVWPCLAPRPRRERRNMRPRVRLRPGGRLIASDVVGAETLGCCTCGGERSNRNGAIKVQRNTINGAGRTVQSFSIFQSNWDCMAMGIRACSR